MNSYSYPLHTYPLHTYKRGAGFPMLCLHGHPGSGRSMGIFAEYFADESRSLELKSPMRQRFTTIAPDLRGYGKSQPGRGFEITDHLDDLAGLLDQNNAQRSLILGWSLGGIFAMEMALRFPERVSGLILIATAARPWGDHPPISLRDNLLTGIAGLINLIKPGWAWNINTLGRRSLFRHLIQQHTAEAYKFLASDAVYAYLKTSRYANQALNRAIGQGYNRVPDLPKIQCPTLVLMGECDRHISPSASLETAKALPNCEWDCYPQTAHLLPWEIPGTLLHRIDTWIDKYPDVTQ